jgi:SAM-dependent methyltransferase
MLRDAGRLTIELALDLNECDLTLQDASPWNVIFRGTQPIFVDVTSLIPIRSRLVWQAYEQFQSFFTRPLQLAAQGAGDVARALLQNNVAGVTVGHLYRMFSLYAKLRHPGVPIAYLLERALARSPRLSQKLAQSVSPEAATPTRQVRARFFRKLSRALEQFRFPSRKDGWTEYYCRLPEDCDTQQKIQTVSSVLRRLQPNTVLDLGCNTGAFSILAAENGARVVAIDSSESSIEQLYRTAKVQKLSLTPLVADVLCPTPSLGFLSGEFPSLAERLRTDLVMCLGLLHHLHVTGRQPLARVASILDRLSARYAIVEYVDPMDESTRAMTRSSLAIFNLQMVCHALSQWFPSIEILPSDRKSRQILVCTK